MDRRDGPGEPGGALHEGQPTIPRLYVKGELVGGCDIVREMYEAGELQDMLAKARPSGADVGA